MFRAAPFWGFLGRPLAGPRAKPKTPDVAAILVFWHEHAFRRAFRFAVLCYTLVSDRNPVSAKCSARYPAAALRPTPSRPATNGHHSPANASLARFNHIADRSIRAKTTSQA